MVYPLYRTGSPGSMTRYVSVIQKCPACDISALCSRGHRYSDATKMISPAVYQLLLNQQYSPIMNKLAQSYDTAVQQCKILSELSTAVDIENTNVGRRTFARVVFCFLCSNFKSPFWYI